MSDLGQRIANLSPEKRALLELRLSQKGPAAPAGGEIRRRATTGPCPVSFAQQRLWFLDQLEPGRPVYNLSEALRLRGPLDAVSLERALVEIVRRHEVLRTTYASIEGRPVQVISPNTVIDFRQLDLSAIPTAEREAEALRIMSAEAEGPFDLARGPVFRARLAVLAEEDHTLLVTMHHIASDGWSIGVLLSELEALYEAFSKGEPSPLPDPPVQYADFAVWQREWLKGEVLESQLSYWRRELEGAPPVLELPTDRPRPAVATHRGAALPAVIPSSLRTAIQRVAQGERTTLFMILLAAFQVLLHRYTGNPDIVVGSPIANRNRGEIEGLIGFFVNTLVLRGDLSGDPTFLEFLGRVRKAALGGYGHQDLPFEKLVEELSPERDMSHNPLFQVMLVLEDGRRGGLDLGGLSVEPVDIESRVAKFDLTLEVVEGEGGVLKGWWEYSTDLFDAPTIVRIAGHFRTLLEGIVADPGRKLWELPLLDEEERHRLLVDWNGALAPYPKDRRVHELVGERAASVPESTAVEFGGERLAYGELNRRANRLARYLRGLGVGPEVVVGLCVERSLEMVVGVLGILKAGGAYVPLDPDYPEERTAFMLEDSGAALLVTREGVARGLPASGVARVCLDSDGVSIERESGEDPNVAVDARNLAYVIYTSGSTGRPKGVLVEHGNLMHSTWARLCYYGGGVGSYLLLPSLAFDSSVAGIFSTLCQGGRLVVPGEGVERDPVELARLIESRGVTHLLCVPSLYGQILGEAKEGKLSSLRVVVVAGEACPRELVEAHRRRLPGVAFFNEYGPTEATVWATVYECGELLGGGRVPIGRPIANARVYVLDGWGEPVPVGVSGELYVGGEGVSRGYRRKPELTAENFVPDRFGGEPSGRLYRTGDRARFLPDGNIDLLGRLDDQVKIRGFRIELGEIEAVLAVHPGVRECAVAVREDAPGDKRLVAYIVAADPQSPPSGRGLRGWAKERLPEFMLPSTFVALGSLPRTAGGKVNRRALPAPREGRLELEEAFAAPRTPVEEAVARMWAEVLRRERVGVHDNFFDLGGHSLLATQLVARIREGFSIELPLRVLFEGPTVAELSVAIAQVQARRAEPEEVARLLAELEGDSGDTPSPVT